MMLDGIMKRRTILKGIGATGLLAAGGATPGLAAVTDAPAGGDLYLSFDDDREAVAVDPADVEFGPDEIQVTLDDGEVFYVPPGCYDCCDACDCFGCLCYWCPNPIE